jgi:hypothetical protein
VPTSILAERFSGENNNKINRIETGPAADRSRLSAAGADCYDRVFRQ